MKLNIADIDCEVEYKNIKNSYIQIKDNRVIVKVPIKATRKYINELVSSKKDWIEKNLQQQKNKPLNKNIIKVLGKAYTLQVIENKPRNKVYLKDNYIYFEVKENNNEVIQKLLDKFYKEIAKDEVYAAMEYVKSITGLSPKEIRIKKLKSAWGICSSKQYISINQNLMAYSRHAIEYVCLHEVCHLKHMNHSKEFWKMVEKYMPDYKTAKLELKNA